MQYAERKIPSNVGHLLLNIFPDDLAAKTVDEVVARCREAADNNLLWDHGPLVAWNHVALGKTGIDDQVKVIVDLILRIAIDLEIRRKDSLGGRFNVEH